MAESRHDRAAQHAILPRRRRFRSRLSASSPASAGSIGAAAAIISVRAAPACLPLARRRLACRGQHRGAGRRRSGLPRAARACEPPPAQRPRALAVLQTSGWEIAAPEARRDFGAAAARLAEAGIALADRRADPLIEEVEAAISDAAEQTRAINAWEGRWP